MDFFESQERARKTSKRLVVYFGVAVLAVALAVGAVVAGAHFLVRSKVTIVSDGQLVHGPQSMDPGLFLGVGGGTMLVILLGSLFKSLQLAGGGEAVARSLGGRKLDSNTTDADERKLLNVVEEMSIASGVPVPEVYLLDHEDGINAFAAGRTTSDAVIGATRGCVKNLTRDELQGVVAHEFSHILNGDMRLNLRLMGLLFGILMITVMGRIILRSIFHGRVRSSSNSKQGGAMIAIMVFAFALVVVGYIGVLAANLIKAAVSRQREYLADASAVQFTRDPAGLSGALKKIGGLTHGSSLGNAHAEEASHMFFASGLRAGLTNALSTHPPLNDRIRAIDKHWDGKFPRVELANMSSSIATDASDVHEAASGMAALAGTVASGSDTITRPRKTSQRPDYRASQLPQKSAPAAGEDHLRMAGNQVPGSEVNGEQVKRAHSIYSDFPEEWVAAAHNEAGAQALIFAMLLAQDDDLRGGELSMLESDTDPATYRTVMALYSELGDLPSAHKIALIDLSIPTLRRLSPEEYHRFKRVMARLIQSDGRIDLFEFMLQKIVSRHLDICFGRQRPPRVKYRRIAPLAEEAAVLISTLAFLGNDEQEGERSFAAGAAEIEPHVGGVLPMKTAEQCSIPAIDAALSAFECSSPLVKKVLLTAGGKAVMSDGRIASDEAELLRAMADTMDSPIPPFVQSAA